MKKYLRFVFLFVVMYATGNLMAQNGNWTDAGNYSATALTNDGTNYYINNESEFALLAYSINNGDNTYQNKVIHLNADLNMSAHYWIPIGTSSNNFKSRFDGHGHTIQGINVNRTGSSHNGLFGIIYGDANSRGSIHNLVLLNSTINGGDYTGGIVGLMYGSTEVANVVCGASVAGGNRVGGIVGCTDTYISGSMINAPEIHGCLYIGTTVSGTSNRAAIIGEIDSYVVHSGNYYSNQALDGVNSADVRAYEISNLNTSSEVIIEFNYSAGISYEGNPYVPATATVSFTTTTGTLCSVINSVMVDGSQVSTHRGTFSIVVNASNHTVNATAVTTTVAGAGTEASPFAIATTTDWSTLVNEVSYGESLEGKFVNLTNNLTVTSMVGASGNPFAGIFNGGGHTLTFNIGSEATPFGEDYCAPFRYVSGATIKNIFVDGDIYTSAQYAAGLVGYTTLRTTLEDCFVSMNIHSSVSGAGYHGGIIAHTDQSSVGSVENSATFLYRCVFAGKMLSSGTSTTNVGGVVGRISGFHAAYSDGAFHGRVRMDGCFFVPSEVTMNSTGSFTMSHDNGDASGYVILSGCYYLTALGATQGHLCTATATDGELNHRHTLADGRVLYSAVTIEGVSSPAYFDGNNAFNPIVKDAYGNAFTRGTHYTLTIKDANNQAVTNISQIGTYTLTFAGDWTNVTGTKVMTYIVNGLTGSGTALDPFVISTTDDWNVFVAVTNSGKYFSGKYLLLENSITVSSMAKRFDGIFWGNGKTLTFNVGTEDAPYNSKYCAPFKEINKAEIYSLATAGDIYTSQGNAAGLAAIALKKCKIEDCRSSIAIHSTYTGESRHAGFVSEWGEMYGGSSTINRCVFDGKLLGSSSNTVGGFVGYVGLITLNFNNCLFVPTEISVNTSSSGNFVADYYYELRWDGLNYYTISSTIHYNGCYYYYGSVSSLGTNRGTKADVYYDKPGGIGSSSSLDEGTFITVFSNGLKFGDKYYAKINPNTFTTAGDWNNAANWSWNAVPAADENVIINANAVIPTGCVAVAGNITVNTGFNITIRDGGELMAANLWQNSTPVPVVIEKYFEGNVWHALANPVFDNIGVTSVGNLTNGSYDLFQYNELDATWENYKTHYQNDFSSLNNGRGYIYRRASAGTLTFSGGSYFDEIDYALNARCSDLTLRGFNLIGNPYPHSIMVYQPYYELLGNGTWRAHEFGIVGVAQAILVHTDTNDSVFHFNNSLPSQTKGNPTPTLSFTVSNGEYEDVAYVMLETELMSNGSGLPKMKHINSATPMLSLPLNGGDYALAYLSEEVKSFPLNINAISGEYTITASANVAYCHLVDCQTGAEVDLQSQPSYTFKHNGNSASPRFLVKLSPYSDNANLGESAVFAHWNGNSLIIEGTGTLHVFDIMGRQIINRVISTPNTQLSTLDFPASGVYILRLGEKTQKITIIRGR